MGDIYNINDFGGTNVQQTTQNRNHTCKQTGQSRYTTNPNAKYNEHGDSFESSKSSRQKQNAQHRRPLTQEEKRQIAIKRAWANRILGAITAASIIAGGAKVADVATSPHDNFNAAGHTIEEVADWTDIDADLLLLINDIEAEDADEPVQEMILPSVYSPVSDEISEIEAQLLDDSLTSAEKTELEEKLAELTEKKEAQDDAATVYSVDGGRYVYIVLNRDAKAEEIKDLYGIKDGVLKDNNDLSYKWGLDTSVDVHQGYRDYTDTVVKKDTILKVPQKEFGAAEE